MTELTKRMEAIESLLSRLEQKMVEPPQQVGEHSVRIDTAFLSLKGPTSHAVWLLCTLTLCQLPCHWTDLLPLQLDSHSAVDLEEVKLSRKLQELTGNISDKGLSSEEDEAKVPPTPKETQRKDGVRGEPALAGPIAPERVMSSSSDEQLLDAQKVRRSMPLATVTQAPYSKTLQKTQQALQVHADLAMYKPTH